jgi:predicted phosphodiesterase
MTDAIFCADLHLRDDTPLCRTDDYWKAQKRKIDFIFDLIDEKHCPLIIAGDLGHRPKWSNALLNVLINNTIRHFNLIVMAVPGQHDLSGREEKDINSTAFGVLFNAGIIDSPSGKITPFESIESYRIKDRKIGVTHQMIIEDKPLWPGQVANTGIQILKKNPEYDCIVSGDNHLPFVAEYKGRILVNPGSMMRMTAAQIDHKPRVYLYDAKSNSVEPVFLPIEEEVVSRKHIEEKQERERRAKEFNDIQVQAYINKVKGQEGGSISFKKNMEKYFGNNEIEDEVKQKIMEKMK